MPPEFCENQAVQLCGHCCAGQLGTGGSAVGRDQG